MDTGGARTFIVAQRRGHPSGFPFPTNKASGVLDNDRCHRREAFSNAFARALVTDGSPTKY